MTETRIISIGALDAHPLWKETAPARSGHSTTTLVASGDARVLVDPGLPAEILVPRLRERANLKPEDITHVFLTCFRPDCRRGIAAFDDAQWLIAEAEREHVGVPLVGALQRAEESGDTQTRDVVAQEIALLRRCTAAPDKIAPGIDLFPLPGVTPGMAGLLLPEATRTTLVAGDAVLTTEHLAQGVVAKWAMDPAQAQESFMEALEIADVIIPGRDNLLINPTRRPF